MPKKKAAPAAPRKAKPSLAQAYSRVADVASPSDSEGLKKERAILLLWYLRNVMGIDDLEAYEYICDGDSDQGVDGLYLERAYEGQEFDVLHIFQSKYPESPKNIGVTEIRSLVGTVAPFETVNGLKKLVKGDLEPELRQLIQRFDLETLLERGTLRVEATLVAAGALTDEARRLLEAHNESRGRRLFHGVDALDLLPIIEAFTSPATVKGIVRVAASSSQRFIAPLESSRVAVCSVPVTDLVAWPGIDDRRLFDLNVRRELSRSSKVRRALDRAITKRPDHKNFLAFHNGLTVVCSKIDDSHPDYLTLTDVSVVNGAQSTIAFRDNRQSITTDLRVVVKFVEVPGERQLAREVAIRSNTQNPVNPRHLRARDGVQLRLEAEMKKHYPSITYELRPDATMPASGKTIQNDDAAQLLCAVYNQEPWHAVRRLLLFESDFYTSIFTRATTAARIVLVDLIARRVQANKSRFPGEYLRSWRLTKLVAVYLVGQLLRTSPDLMKILDNPATSLRSRGLSSTLDRLVKFAAAAMKTRQEELDVQGDPDDFKVDFKRESALKELASTARKTYVTYKTVEN
jgi:hypothetical protein